MEYPAVYSKNLIPCGPIIQASLPISEADPELDRWLKRGNVLLINLGSHWFYDETMATKMLSALKQLLRCRRDIIVLWKLRKFGTFALDWQEDEFKNRFRVTEWLAADPGDILRSHRVICFVHYGGSNSYHEALL